MAPKGLDFSSTFEEIRKHPTKIIIIIIIMPSSSSSSSSSSFIIITPSPPFPFLSPNPSSKLIIHKNPSMNNNKGFSSSPSSYSPSSLHKKEENPNLHLITLKIFL
ncbi:unnamed protein product [Citrullus colocynthis]|uniref:Uncharacterized protein n=1 Tax=Citrullus colocynthis TaxID=252529 RepID=A0ABP0XUT2_9ROSI